MKISYYEAFDFIAEEAVELLAEDVSNDSVMKDFPLDATINDVMKNVSIVRKKRKSKSTWTIRLLVAIFVILALSTTVFAITQRLLVKDGGAELLTDSNRDLSGRELTAEAAINDTDGNIIDKSEAPKYESYDWKTSSVIKSVEKDAHIPRVISEFIVQDEGDFFTTPEIVFTNDCMVILKKENGSGWHLKKGEQLEFKVELYPSEINSGSGKGQGIIYQYVLNGKLMEQSSSDNKLVQSYSIKAEKTGEYFICLTGGSSDPISLKQGKIIIK